jgi:hypothetical protein
MNDINEIRQRDAEYGPHLHTRVTQDRRHLLRMVDAFIDHLGLSCKNCPTGLTLQTCSLRMDECDMAKLCIHRIEQWANDQAKEVQP